MSSLIQKNYELLETYYKEKLLPRGFDFDELHKKVEVNKSGHKAPSQLISTFASYREVHTEMPAQK